MINNHNCSWLDMSLGDGREKCDGKLGLRNGWWKDE